MAHVFNEVDVQRVPLAVFPVAHLVLGALARDKIVVTIADDLAGILTVGQLHNPVAHQVIDVTFGSEHINLSLATALDFNLIFIARREQHQETSCYQ